MRRIVLPLAAGALVAAAALAFELSPARAIPPRAPSATPSALQPAPPVPAPAVAAALQQASAAPSAALALQPREHRSGNNDLLALEDQALRRIDIAPVLESAGVDVHALAARPDGEDVLRHAAADELLTRAFMRDLFSFTVYPYGYPEDHAQAEARAVAQQIIAKLSPEDRASTLQRALAGSTDVPEPYFYPPDSGHVFDGHFRNDPARN